MRLLLPHCLRVSLLNIGPELCFGSDVLHFEDGPAERAPAMLSEDGRFVEAIFAEVMAAKTEDDRLVENIKTDGTCMILFYSFLFAVVILH